MPRVSIRRFSPFHRRCGADKAHKHENRPQEFADVQGSRQTQAAKGSTKGRGNRPDGNQYVANCPVQRTRLRQNSQAE